MEWIKPNRFDTREITKFLFLPKKIGRKVRWLEKATWEEQYVRDNYWCKYCWKSTKWLDRDNEYYD